MDLSLLQDKTQLPKFCPNANSASAEDNDGCPVRSIECFRDADPLDQYLPQAWMVPPRGDGFLRILFAPPDYVRLLGIATLMRNLEIPDAFILESNITPCSSFGHRAMPDGGGAYWGHIVFKSIELDQSGRVVNNTLAYGRTETFSYGDYEWRKFGFFLRWSPGETSKGLAPASNMPQCGGAAQIEFCCFGASYTLRRRLTDMCFSADTSNICRDPFILLNIVLEQMYIRLDRPIGHMKAIGFSLENDTLALAKRQKPELQQYDFVGLYNVSKHVVHLKESCDAIAQVCQTIQRAHARFAADRGVAWNAGDLCQAIEGELDHKASLLNSHILRLESLDRRLSNLTNLAFNMINQKTGLMAIEDSTSMRMIGVLTLIFLPFASIAALFSTPFFSATEAPSRIYVARDFWLFWAIVVPLTLFLLGAASLANALSMKQRGGGIAGGFPGGWRAYLKWSLMAVIVAMRRPFVKKEA